MNPKVFISSTYEDLKNFRELLWNELKGLDIQILGMEDFGARSSNPLETCMKEIEKCQVYIGIIAYKYGSEEKNSKKSYTQLEYEKAFELNKEILIYIFSDEGFISPKYIDFDYKANLLLEFKKTLKERHTISFFTQPEELAQKVYNDIRKLIPTLSKKAIRPKIIDSRIFRFTMNQKDWILFVGYQNGYPTEVHMGESYQDVLPIPKMISVGKIKREIEESGNERYDFLYVDKFGYTNLIGGLNYIFDQKIYDNIKILTALLRNYTPLENIISALEVMRLDNEIDQDIWRKKLKEALLFYQS